MMSFEFIDIPFRPSKPRKLGISMILDKSMSQEELSQMLSIGGRYIDIIKFGWGTSRLIEKEVHAQAGHYSKLLMHKIV